VDCKVSLPEEDWRQLWRRIIFNIAVSNIDDHLRNHGFILTQKGWRLCPAFDLNPSVDKNGLALNIDMESNELDHGLAKSSGIYIKLLDNNKMNQIIIEVKDTVYHWKKLTAELGMPRAEQMLMEHAFKA